MIDSGNAVQQALFRHLEANPDLIKFFRPRLIEGQGWPQFSFDGLLSQWRHQPIGLVLHQADFSIWADTQAYADAGDLFETLAAHLLDNFEVEGLEIIQTRLTDVISQIDATSQLWQTRFSFEVLTQKRTWL